MRALVLALARACARTRARTQSPLTVHRWCPHPPPLYLPLPPSSNPRSCALSHILLYSLALSLSLCLSASLWWWRRGKRSKSLNLMLKSFSRRAIRRCSLLQCVAVWCSVLQNCVVCKVLQCVALCCSVCMHFDAQVLFQNTICVCSALHCGAECCRVLQCVTMCCSMLYCVVARFCKSMLESVSLFECICVRVCVCVCMCVCAPVSVSGLSSY